MNTVFSGLGRFVVRHRYLVVLFWLVVVVVSSRALPSLGSEVNNNNSQFLSPDAPSQKAADLATPLLGNVRNETPVTIVASREGSPLTPADQEAIVREVSAVEGVGKVAFVRGLGLSPDGDAAQILVEAHVSFNDISGQKKLVDALEATFARADTPPGLQFHLAGQVPINVANQNASQKTQSRTQSFTFLVVIVLLLLIFRSLLGPVVTLIPPAVALVVSMRFIGGLGAHGLQISEITQLLLIVLLIGAGTDYGLFLVFRVREEIGGGRDPRDAVVYSLVRVGESISASAGTVIFALLTLLLASFGIYHDLAVPLALGVAVMLLAGLTLLPALLAIFGGAVFWPGKLTSLEDKEGLWGRVAARLVQRPGVTLCSGVALFGALSLAALGYHSGGFGGSLTAPAGTDAAAGSAALAAHFPRASSNPTNLVFRFPQPVWESPQSLATLHSELAASGEFTQLTGPLNPNGHSFTPAEYARLHQELGNPALLPEIPPPGVSVDTATYNAYRATSVLVSPNGHTVQFESSLSAGDPGSTSALQAIPRVRHAVTAAGRAAGASESGVAGEAPAIYDVSSASNSDLVRIIPVAVIAIGILLALVLRSLVAPWYLIASVVLSYLAALGLSTIFFIDIEGNGGLTFILPFLMFIFLLALGEDYNILVMSRIREEAHRDSLRKAVVRAVGRTGPTVTSAGLVLAASFAALAIAGGSGPQGGQVRAIGFGLAVGILMDTFLVRTLLVPSTVSLLGRWNWWPSRMGRRPRPLPTEEAHVQSGNAAAAGDGSPVDEVSSYRVRRR